MRLLLDWFTFEQIIIVHIPFYRELLFYKGQMLLVFPLQFDQLISESLHGLSKMIDILEYDILTTHQLNIQRHVCV